MGFRRVELGIKLVARAEYDSDLIKFITALAKNNGITTATFTVIGALKNAKLGFYDQERQGYSETLLLAPQEIASCTGNISLKEGTPFIHAHAVLADGNGNTKAGHLLEGKVFAAEIHLAELLGTELERKNDLVTGLSLWDI